jgi:hypothetical protein
VKDFERKRYDGGRKKRRFKKKIVWRGNSKIKGLEREYN